MARKTGDGEKFSKKDKKKEKYKKNCYNAKTIRMFENSKSNNNEEKKNECKNKHIKL